MPVIVKPQKPAQCGLLPLYPQPESSRTKMVRIGRGHTLAKQDIKTPENE